MRKNMFLVALSSFIMIGTVAFSQMSMPTMKDTITVISSGEATTVPDICNIEFSLESTGESFEDILSDIESQISNAKSALEAISIQDITITVSKKQYSQAGTELQKMIGNAGGIAPEGYTVKTSVSVSFGIKEMETSIVMGSIDTILNASKKTKLTLVKFGFGISDETKLQQQALENALSNSAKEAKSIAVAGGREIVRTESFMIFDMAKMMGGMFGGMGSQLKGMMDAIFPGGALSESPELVTISTTVFVIYGIK